MSTLLGRIEKTTETGAGHGMYQPRGSLFMYDDCCVWRHGKWQPATEEQTQLSPDELAAQDKHNWRVNCADIAHAYCREVVYRGEAGPGMYGNNAATPDQFATILDLKLADGSGREVTMWKAEDDHSQKELCQRWLGERLELGAPPPPSGVRGKLARAGHKMGLW